MNLILTFALVGLFLIYLEFFFLSGILGVCAAASLIASIVFFVFQGHAWGWMALYSASLLVATGFVCKLALSKVKKKVALHQDQENFVASSYDASLIGKEGIVLSDLKPSGHILVEEIRAAAFSETGYISKDTHIIVTGGRGAMLIVKQLPKR
jgi:membrane-bound serine protease (ClpP class)